VAGRAFLSELVQHLPEVKALVQQAHASMLTDDVPAGACGQVLRVAGRFALVGTAGELATEWGLTGWQPGEAAQAAVRLFHEWLALRGGSGDSEASEGIAQVRRFLETHGESRFSPWHESDHASRTHQRAGFLRAESEGICYYVLPEVFKREVCKGMAHQPLAKALSRRGMLRHDKERLTLKSRLPGMGAINAYVITPAIWGDA
jgi:uncharacterized protein (DUF927 family)